MTGALIYHGTPLTPRAALDAVMPGRAGCVSYFRPDSLEALLAICPQMMFRQRRVLILDAGASSGHRPNGRAEGRLDGLLRVARPDGIPSGPLGDHPRYSSGAVPAQRRAVERLAVRRSRRAGLAHGRVDRASGETVQPIFSRLPRLDRRPEERAGRVPCISSQDGRGCGADGQHLAPAAHAARHAGRSAISLRVGRQHVSSAERSPL